MHPPIRDRELSLWQSTAFGLPFGDAGRLAMELAQATLRGDAAEVKRLEDDLRFSRYDPRWLESVEQYLAYFQLSRQDIPYRSGVDAVHTMPETATLAIIGDWGTGTETAKQVLRRVARHNPDILFHLGDIYYSGTQAECARFLSDVRDTLPATAVYTLCGNHDVYSGGAGYYWLVDQLGQRASYFAVRNASWQLLGLDTGFGDFNPLTVTTHVTGLQPAEAAWHREKLRDGRKTVLLSHHPLFSAFDGCPGYANGHLLADFHSSLSNVAAWFWGHEHKLALYGPCAGLQRGRCVGCSAVPVFADPVHDAPKNTLPLLPITLGTTDGVYNHGYAIMQLAGDAATVEYYQHTTFAPLYTETM